MQAWPDAWPIELGNLKLALPLVRSQEGFGIYAFDPMGRGAWNIAAAETLAQKLAAYDFDILLTAESKAIAITEQLAQRLGQDDYVVLRKAKKLYMTDPLEMGVKSITTEAKQTFFLGKDQQELLRGKRLCVVDDVISTGGTLRAVHQIALSLDCRLIADACVLTEEVPRTEFEGVPVVSLGHIPLPAFSEGIA